MNLADWHGPMAYWAVFIATIIEGEVVFVAASILVGMGQLDSLGVFAAAALGGSVGDQLYFYGMRGRFRSWLKRFPSICGKQEKIAIFVQRNATAMILACRFLPGLRVAIPAACAHAGVSPGRFSTFSLLSSAAWAGLILAVVGHYGPASLSYFGVDVWWAPIIPGALILSLFSWAARKEDPMLKKFGSEK